MGMHVVPSLHSMLRSKDHRPSKVQRLINRLDQPLFARSCTAIMSASEDISEQVRCLSPQSSRPIVSFLPTYRPEMFDQITLPDYDERPFRVMYAGRIVREKGVFELLKIAKRFLDTGIDDIEWDVCGSGGDLGALKQASETAGVGRVFHCHGRLEKPVMADMFSRSHVLVVPTMAYCVEGFNQVVVEGALVGRPVVTSSVCPAIRYVRDAVVEVPPDDTQAYGDAILKLYEDKGFYQGKHQGSLKVRGNFFDPLCGWGAALTHILTAIEQGRSPEPVSWLDAGTT
jgi:glycogen(starch) synthase